MRRAGLSGFTFVETLVAVAISALVSAAGFLAVRSYQNSQMAAQYPVEMGRILAASRAFLKDYRHLPELSVAQDAALWPNYYRPASNLVTAAGQLLPAGWQYVIVRPYLPSGVTTGAFPGQIRVVGSGCEQYDGNPLATCDYTVPFY